MKLSNDVETLTIGTLRDFLSHAERAGAQRDTEVTVIRRRSSDGALNTGGGWTLEVQFEALAQTGGNLRGKMGDDDAN